MMNDDEEGGDDDGENDDDNDDDGDEDENEDEDDDDGDDANDDKTNHMHFKKLKIKLQKPWQHLSLCANNPFHPLIHLWSLTGASRHEIERALCLQMLLLFLSTVDDLRPGIFASLDLGGLICL